MTAAGYGPLLYVLTLPVVIAIALVGTAAGLVIAAALVKALVHALFTGGGILRDLLAPSTPPARATASFHPGDRP